MKVNDILYILQQCNPNDVLHQHLVIENEHVYAKLCDIDYAEANEEKIILAHLSTEDDEADFITVNQAIQKLKDFHPDDVLFVITGTENLMFKLKQVNQLHYVEVPCNTHGHHKVLSFETPTLIDNLSYN